MIQPKLEIDFSASKRRAFLEANNEYSPQINEFLFNHNRSAIQFILNLLEIKGDQVAVLAYNCHTVMNAVHQAGGTPIFIDVDRKLHMDIDDLKRKNEIFHFSAVIVTHLFGIYNDIDSIRQIINVPIIEDCAHAYLSPNCGTKGDFAVYSIGQGKLPSIGDGGICIVNNPCYIEKFTSSFIEIPDYSLSERLSLCGHLAIKHMCYKPFIYPILKTIGKHQRVRVIEPVKIRKMDKGISTLYNECGQNLSKIICQRQGQAMKTIRSLSEVKANPLINPKDTNCFMLPLDCENIVPVRIYFRKKRIETATHFDRCIEWAKNFGYEDGDCPNAEYFTKHLLVVPTYR